MKILKRFLTDYWILLVLILVKMILQYTMVNPAYELHRDEFLYLDQSFHLQAGYISVPPLTAWISKLVFLLGGGLFWIRFFPAFFGALTIVFAWLIVEELKGGPAAKLLTSTFLLFSVYTRLSILFQPNSFDTLAWTAVFYFLIMYCNTKQSKWLFVLAITIALGFYNKYNIIFLIAGLIPALALTKQRNIFRQPALYFALVFCLLLLLPNILWQITNRFPVIHHMAALNHTQLVNVNRIDFLSDQLKFGMVGILTLLAWWALIFYKPFGPYRFIGITFLVTITLYTLCRAKNYYALGLYPVFFAIGGVYLDAILKKGKAAIIIALVVINATVFFAISKYIMPVPSPAYIAANHADYEKLGMLRWEDGKNHILPQDFADMLGWKEMADLAYKAYISLPDSEKANTLIYTDNYGQVGALNYYNRNRTPKAFSFNTDYLFWFPEGMHIRNLVFVGNVDDDICRHFTTCKLMGKIENPYAREKGTTVYQLRGADNETTENIYKIVKERRATFDCF
jgi:4-amino-4-deoxy-L-arabinose transferase-like glycosyltransferase